MKKIQDEVFGEVVFSNFSWKKNIDVKIWGEQVSLEVNVNDLDENGISDIQRKKYVQVKDVISEYIDDNLEKFIEHCKNSFDLPNMVSSDISSNMKPQRVVFQRDGSWGILFDTEYDIEHGIALFFTDNDVRVDIQDEFL
jgi:hypothetical protein